jgi:hypothetical protein
MPFPGCFLWLVFRAFSAMKNPVTCACGSQWPTNGRVKTELKNIILKLQKNTNMKYTMLHHVSKMVGHKSRETCKEDT